MEGRVEEKRNSENVRVCEGWQLPLHTYLCATSKREQIDSLVPGHGLSNLCSPTDSGADGRRKVIRRQHVLNNLSYCNTD